MVWVKIILSSLGNPHGTCGYGTILVMLVGNGKLTPS